MSQKSTDPCRNMAISGPLSLKAQLQAEAHAQGISYGALCQRYLTQGLQADHPEDNRQRPGPSNGQQA